MECLHTQHCELYTMAPATVSDLHIPVFAGQGTAASNTPQVREQALRDASSPSASTLLSACHDSFISELSTMSLSDLQEAEIDLADFAKPATLISLPLARYRHNPVVSGPTLFLLQALRYLAFIDHVAETTGSFTPFSDVLQRNAENGTGVLGLSSGILPAVIVGTSLTTATFISRAVEAYRLAIWIGVRTQAYRRAVLAAAPPDQDPSLPWSLVFLGLTRDVVEDAVTAFNQQIGDRTLFVTAIADNTCITVSGQPDHLATFSASLSADAVVHKTSLDTLYHSAILETPVRDKVVRDINMRNIKFPSFSDVRVPIRSTLTGDSIMRDSDSGSGSLVETIVDMIITQPINWDLVVAKTVATVPQEVPVRLLNCGPGSGLTKGLDRAFSRQNVSTLDLAKTSLESEEKAKQEPIAIIGMAVNMPGAPNNDKLWEVLETGINTIREIPEQRFSVANYNSGKNAKRSMKAHTGNFVDNADEFDNKFFKISPREAKSMDPQQRLLLHAAYEALEDAGYVPNSTDTWSQDTFGCYVGVATHDYLQNLRNEIDVYYSTGTLKAFLSGRISYAMQLSGPSVVVDTACSSSAVAFYQGARSLANHDCNAALVGGVTVISSPDMMLGLDRGHFLSPTGQCKAFDVSADGYSRSEGVGMFVLKRLSDAIAENDNILGVIRAVEVNQSGCAHSITHPHAPTQANLFRRVLDSAGIEHHRINVIEAHGTGTQAGDPNELESIRSIFGQNRPENNPLHITSVKSNIGHLEAASGAAGMAKLLLMMRNKSIPRLISLKNLNPRIVDLKSDNTIIDTVQTSWDPSEPGLSRVALLNNFGAAGSNTAIILEEHLRSLNAAPEGLSYTFGISAKDSSALETLRARFIDWIQDPKNESASLADISYTTTARRIVFEHRLAVSASNKQELIEKLTKAPTTQVKGAPFTAAFVFSGQGSQYLGMGRSLYKTVPLFKKTIDECHNILTAGGFPGVLAILNSEGESSGLSKLEEFEAYQSAIFSLEYALAKLWISWGITPGIVVGHSLGEYAALVIANVLTLKGALVLIANRVRFMVSKCAVDTTAMIAVNLPHKDAQAAIDSSPNFADLSISCYNSSVDCVLSGPIPVLKAFKAHLDAEVHCKNVLLSVPFGYHSSAMNPLLDDLMDLAKRVTISAPTIPIISNVHGDIVLPGDESVFNAEYFSRHCGEPVQFSKGVQQLIASTTIPPVDAWIEIGPHTTSLPMLKGIAEVPKSALLLGSIRKNQEPWSTLTTTLAQLFGTNAPIRWRNVFDHVPVNCISIPTYPFNKAKFWVAFKEDDAPVAQAVEAPTAQPSLPTTDYKMLRGWTQYPAQHNGYVAIFETPISQLASSIRGHSVGGMPLCPASVYLEQVYAGLKLSQEHLSIPTSGNHTVLRGIEFAKPLVYDEEVSRTVITNITIRDGQGTFFVASRVDGSPEEAVHVHGAYKAELISKTSTKFSRTLPIINRHMSAVVKPRNGKPSQLFSTRTAYEVIFPRVVDYAKEYHTMRSLTVDSTGMEGYASVRLPASYDRSKFVVHPVFTDTLLHVAGFVANMQGGSNDAYICAQVGTVKVIPEQVDNDASYAVYCSNGWLADQGVMLAEAYAVKLSQPPVLVAHIKDMHFRKVRLNSLKKGLAHAAGKFATPQKTRFAAMPSIATRPSQPSPVTAPATPKISAPTIVTDSSRIQSEITRIVAETCDVSASNIGLTTDLGALGVDSLMSIEIFGKLEATFPSIPLDATKLSHCNSVADIIAEVSSNAPAGSSRPTEPESTVSSPRTLVPDETLPEPTPLVVNSDVDVKNVLAAVLDVSAKDIGDDADFETLGLDSLTSIEALAALKTEFGIDLPGHFFDEHKTAKKVQTYLASHLSSRSSSSQQKAPVHETVKHQISAPKATIPEKSEFSITIAPASATRLTKALKLDAIPLPLQKSTSSSLPLFLIHDGSGLINYYNGISSLGRQVWGFNNPHFVSSEPWAGVVEMASAYADYISKITQGPVILGGWSFGGVAAYETSLQLAKKGIVTKGILLIDSPSPINHVPLSDSLIDSVVNLDSRSANSDLGRLVKAQFAMNARMLGVYDPHATGGTCPPLVMLRSSEGFNPPGVKDVPIWLADRSDAKLATHGWDTLASTPIKVIDIPGHHFTPFYPANIKGVAASMIEGCTLLDRA